jgi:Protein of unknown function (DUF3606)
MPLTKHEPPVRNQIKPADVKHWCKHWNVEPDQVQAAISKVGNSVAAVEKELGQAGPKKRRKTSPMQSQPIHLDVATPMAPAPTKSSKTVGTTGRAFPKGQAELIRHRSLKKQRRQLSNGEER